MQLFRCFSLENLVLLPIELQDVFSYYFSNRYFKQIEKVRMKEQELKEKLTTVLLEYEQGSKEVFLDDAEREVHKSTTEIMGSDYINFKGVASLAGCMVLVIIAVIWGLYLFFSTLPANPWGKITSLSSKNNPEINVKVIGETKNIESGQYLWLTIDNPDSDLCWPKVPRISPNMKFQTIIDQENERKPFAISLYAVNRATNEQWQAWLSEGRIDGLPIPPENKRLHTVLF